MQGSAAAPQPRISLSFRPSCERKNEILKRRIVCLNAGLDIQLNFRVIRCRFHWGLHGAYARLPIPAKSSNGLCLWFLLLKNNFLTSLTTSGKVSIYAKMRVSLIIWFIFILHKSHPCAKIVNKKRWTVGSIICQDNNENNSFYKYIYFTLFQVQFCVIKKPKTFPGHAYSFSEIIM